MRGLRKCQLPPGRRRHMCRPGFFEHGSSTMIARLDFLKNHKAMKEISKFFAFLQLFISQEVSISSVNSFYSQCLELFRDHGESRFLKVMQ